MGPTEQWGLGEKRASVRAEDLGSRGYRPVKRRDPVRGQKASEEGLMKAPGPRGRKGGDKNWHGHGGPKGLGWYPHFPEKPPLFPGTRTPV